MPSITGIPASGPMSPRPSTAVPSVTTAAVFHRAVLCDIRGIVYPGRPDLKDDPALAELAELTGPEITEDNIVSHSMRHRGWALQKGRCPAKRKTWRKWR